MTSYEGCHPVIAESLKRGEHVECADGFGGIYTVVAYVFGDNFPYVCTDCKRRANLYPLPKTETWVIKASKLVKILEDEGYECDKKGFWRKEDHNVSPEIFAYCGKPLAEMTHFPDKYLEEVEV